jgi:hypothetical protein
MENELYHHGVLGMHWGVRRYQNADGSLTAAGRRKYGISSAKTTMALGVAGLAIAGFTLSQMNNQKRSSGVTYLNQNRNNTVNSVRDLVSVGSNYVNQTSNQNNATSSITNLLSVSSNNLKQQTNTESSVQKLLSVGSDYVARNQKLLSTSKDTNALAVIKEPKMGYDYLEKNFKQTVDDAVSMFKNSKLYDPTDADAVRKFRNNYTDYYSRNISKYNNVSVSKMYSMAAELVYEGRKNNTYRQNTNFTQAIQDMFENLTGNPRYNDYAYKWSKL